MEYAKKLASECLSITEEISLQVGKRFKQFEIKPIVLDKDENPKSSNTLEAVLESIGNIGVYAFVNPQGEISYIGQGGSGSKTPLKKRIGQELRLYNQTSNNAGTLSKNIQTEDSIKFNSENEWKKFISEWNIRVISLDNLDISINVVEAFLIEVIYPTYNIDK